jgi:hypothetical protein
MTQLARRGTTNRNVRGNSRDRLSRRNWLVDTFRADRDHHGEPACRCYRCGKLLTVRDVTVDRIVPGCRGGTYRRNNIRPSCQACASATGGLLGAEQCQIRRVA